MMKNIGTYLLDRLKALGVEQIFGIPGDYSLRLDKLIEQYPGIEFINATRESTAGYMADAYARQKGIGVACITYGVGINIANALAQAYVESSPLIVVSGAAGSDEFAKHHTRHHLINKSVSAYHDMTQLEIFKQVTIDQAVLDDPEKAAMQIDRVLNNCLKYQKPVYIEIPRDRVESHITSATAIHNHFPESEKKSLSQALHAMTTVLEKSQNPIIWAGHEIMRFRLAPFLLQFAEKFHIPIVSSLLGKTVIDERHPLFVGVYQGGLSDPKVKEFVESCDALFILGTLLSDVDTGIFTAKLDQKWQVLATSEMVQIQQQVFSKAHWVDFIKELGHLPLKKSFRSNFISAKESLPKSFSPLPKQKITTARVFECLQSLLQPEHLITTDVGDCLLASADLVLPQNSYLSCAYFASLGFGTPAAIGAQIASSKRRAIGIVGDGGFQMTAMELSTAIRYKLDPIIIVLNNHGYGTERPLLEGTYNDILNWNYTAIIDVLGSGIAYKAHTEEEFFSALTSAIQDRGTFYLIEVELEKTDASPALQRFSALLNRLK